MRRAIVLCAALAAALPSVRAFAAQDAIPLYREGSSAQAVGDYYRAIEKYKAALASNPSYLQAMTGLAECFFNLEDYGEAMRWVDKAKGYARQDSGLQVLEGRILIGQGDVPAARAVFQGVLAREPNNLEARFGMAEADVAQGLIKEAIARYSQGLVMAPESTKALLSLAMLSEETGNQAAAARYYDLVLRSHSDDPMVQLQAARWYGRGGDLQTAEKRARIAISLKPGFEDAEVYLGTVLLQVGRYADAQDVLRQVVTVNRDNTLAWYGLGIAYLGSKDTAKAISSMATVLSIRPEDEAARIAEENAAIDALKMDDPQRQKMAAYHVAQGSLLESQSLLDRAVTEYRRALLLDPMSRDARVDYARIFLTQGFPARYLNELEVLTGLGIKDTLVSDEIEKYTSRLADSLSGQWGVDQFALDRKRYSIPVFTVASSNRLIHPMSDGVFARYFTDMLMRYEAIQVPSQAQIIFAAEDAFRTAREGGSDYYILLSFDESERSFSVQADLYLGSTGARVSTFSAFRTGNDRVRDSFLKTGSDLASALPRRGTLVQRKLDQGLVDLGSFQGIKNGDILTVVRAGKVGLSAEGIGLTYAPSDVVGTMTIQSIDEEAAAGTLARQGWFDFINPLDEVVYPLPQKTPAAAPAPKRNLIQRLFGIGG